MQNCEKEEVGAQSEQGRRQGELGGTLVCAKASSDPLTVTSLRGRRC